ncbi:MAG TPA: 4-hydroxy-tetrahydrodipicolinate synthase [Burkholderiaceae bacterium]|nr:4-hydroxy-tetrahydrodipicolinate synthase [Burkholderiaceae bacterium]
MITGSIVAIVTPMHEDGALDLPALKALVDWHVAEGTNAIVIVGTTGESPTVDFDEHVNLIRAAVEYADKRIPIIAGTGANSTREAVALARAAKRLGADAHLSVVPYYNKPPQEGLYRHFKAIAESVDLPLILYNVPGRTVADLTNETVLRLAEVPGIVGIKDATGNIERGSQLLRLVPEHFAVYSGDDLTAIALMLLGGKGNISVTANVAPRAMSALCAAAMNGDTARAWEIQKALLPLHRQMFVEANPIPVKWALYEMGRISLGMRLPLVPMSESLQPALRDAMREAGIV